MAGKGTTKNTAVEPEDEKQTEYIADRQSMSELKKVTESGRKEETKETHKNIEAHTSLQANKQNILMWKAKHISKRCVLS